MDKQCSMAVRSASDIPLEGSLPINLARPFLKLQSETLEFMKFIDPYTPLTSRNVVLLPYG